MREQGQVLAETICSHTYKEAKTFYETISEGRRDVGFQILYGPPYFRAPILFLGYQPGRGCKNVVQEREYGSEDRWPLKSEYATESWPLAKRLREMVGQEFIERCVGLNAIFIRSDSIVNYRRDFREQLTTIEKFCLPRVEQMVDAIQPRNIVAIGFASLGLFGTCGVASVSEKGRVLTKAGKIAGRDALAVLHLSGARISGRDREIIQKNVLDKIR